MAQARSGQPGVILLDDARGDWTSRTKFVRAAFEQSGPSIPVDYKQVAPNFVLGLSIKLYLGDYKRCRPGNTPVAVQSLGLLLSNRALRFLSTITVLAISTGKIQTGHSWFNQEWYEHLF